MQSTDSSSAQSHDSRLFGFIPSEIALSVATVPVLVGLVSAQALARTIAEVGALSEEVFRGDRLPTLDFPENVSDTPTDQR